MVSFSPVVFRVTYRLSVIKQDSLMRGAAAFVDRGSWETDHTRLRWSSSDRWQNHYIGRKSPVAGRRYVPSLLLLHFP